MKITIVIFYAFDRINKECFLKGESLEDINQALKRICPTYVPVHILEATDAEPLSLNALNRLM